MTFTIDPNIPPVITANRDQQTVTVLWTGVDRGPLLARATFEHKATRGEGWDFVRLYLAALADLDRRPA